VTPVVFIVDTMSFLFFNHPVCYITRTAYMDSIIHTTFSWTSACASFFCALCYAALIGNNIILEMNKLIIISVFLYFCKKMVDISRPVKIAIITIFSIFLYLADYFMAYPDAGLSWTFQTIIANMIMTYMIIK
jgi:hypothetical protein